MTFCGFRGFCGDPETLADLADLPADEPAVRAHYRLLARQRDALAALTEGRCTTACAGSANPWGACVCPCGGSHHAALWAPDLVEVDR